MLPEYPTLRVQAKKSDIQEYKRLLQSDWSRDSLDDALRLLWKPIEGSVTPAAFPWQKVLAFKAGRLSGKDLNAKIIQRIGELAEVFREPPLPAMPSAFPSNRATRSVAQAEMTWAFLVLQALAKLEGETGLFRDTQSLLFLCTIHYLLPQLDAQALRAERNCLLNSMYVHTVLVWRDQPAHCLYLQSLLMDYLGAAERRVELLEMAFRLTPLTDHSYLTKATALWSDLMDLGLRERALTLLMELNRSSPREHQDEIKAMIEEMGSVRNGARK